MANNTVGQGIASATIVTKPGKQLELSRAVRDRGRGAKEPAAESDAAIPNPFHHGFRTHNGVLCN
jgi:hypothetical protein